MELKTRYAFGRLVEMSFEDAEKRVREELAKEGFGVLTEIDVKKKFQEKLGKEFGNYTILGACNPPMAYEALGLEPDLGTLLPCNVVVSSRPEGTAVMVMDPVAVLSLIDNPAVGRLAESVSEKMQRVLASL
jgi:uncharacterized protein (DUF302 family)